MKLKVLPKANMRFGFRVLDKRDRINDGDWIFHDRFLIIDQIKVYLTGSSIGSHVKSHDSTGIFMISDSETATFIISLFNEYWKNANRNEIPVSYLHP